MSHRASAGRVTILLYVVCMLLVGLGGTAPAGVSELPLVNDTSIVEREMATFVDRAFQSRFLENLGQVEQGHVLFYCPTPGRTIVLSEGGISVWLESTGPSMSLFFVNAETAKPEATGEPCSKSHFFLGERGTFTNVRAFEAVTYRGLWPHTNLIVRAAPDGPELEFLVEPGGDIDDIRVRYTGYDFLAMTATSLSIGIGSTIVVDETLRASQGQRLIPVSFLSCAEDTMGLAVADYDVSEQLAINPLLYCTYLGGAQQDSGRSVAVDISGCAYVTGGTSSSGFPRVNPYDNSLDGSDCFVAKLDPSGSSLLYSTFVGGGGIDTGYSIAVDSLGNAFVAGDTDSADFPTVGAYDTSLNGGADLFVLKLSADGSSLLYSTYMGGAANDMDPAITIDGLGSAYVAANSRSSDFPRVNPCNTTYSGGTDGVVFQLSPSGDSLSYSTYLGGSGNEIVNAVFAIDVGSVCVTGTTTSPDFPTRDAMSSTLCGSSDCFISKINTSSLLNGTETLVHSSYLGGSDFEVGTSIVVDIAGNIYIAGITSSVDFPSAEVVGGSTTGDGDMFIVKLDVTGRVLLFSALIGGTKTDRADGVCVDFSGNAYVAGTTYSSNFPQVGARVSESDGSHSDCFVLKLNSSGNGLLYSATVGGSSDDEWPSMALDTMGNVYVTGLTKSTDFPTTGGFSSSYRGGETDCFVLKVPDLHDTDSDGLSDTMEDELGTDKYDADSDHDLLLDGYEVSIGTNPLSADSDLDGLNDYQEIVLFGTNPLSQDSDSDLMLDGWEVSHGLDPLADDAVGDVDQDGLSNLDEYSLGTDPVVSDSDGDLMTDGWEVQYGLNPSDENDSDDDLDNDALTNLQECVLGTNPRSRDTDLDGIPDGWEVSNGFDPLSDTVPLNEIILYSIESIIMAVVTSLLVGLLCVGYDWHLRMMEKRRETELEKSIDQALEQLTTTDEKGSG